MAADIQNYVFISALTGYRFNQTFHLPRIRIRQILRVTDRRHIIKGIQGMHDAVQAQQVIIALTEKVQKIR